MVKAEYGAEAKRRAESCKNRWISLNGQMRCDRDGYKNGESGEDAQSDN